MNEAEVTVDEPEELETLLDISPDAGILHDTTGGITAVDQQTVSRLNFSRDELASMNIADIETAYTAQELQDIWNGLAVGDPKTVEGEHRRQDGSTFPVEVSIQKISIDGEFQILSFSREISQRKQRERELKQYEAFVENSMDLITLVSESAQIEFNNPAIEDILGYEQSELVGENPFEYIHPDDRDFIRTKFEQVLENSNCAVRVEFRFRHADGSWVWLESQARNRLDDPYIEGIVVNQRDITARKRSQQQLEEQRDNLNLLNQMFRHDIRNDLHQVTAYADLLVDEIEGDSEKQEYATKLQDNAQEAVELTKTVRDLADVMLTEQEPDQSKHLQDVLEGEIDAVRSDSSQAVITVDTSIPSVTVRADEMLDSVFRNLLKNAVQHNDKDVPKVNISVEETGETVQVQIADNGPGVPDSQKEVIFGKGEKGIDSPGTGLGLYLVQTLVESYGGNVWVEDNEPEGSIFVVELPRAE